MIVAGCNKRLHCSHKGNNIEAHVWTWHLFQLAVALGPVFVQPARVAFLPVYQCRRSLDNAFVEQVVVRQGRFVPAFFPLLVGVPEMLIVEKPDSFEIRLWIHEPAV